MKIVNGWFCSANNTSAQHAGNPWADPSGGGCECQIVSKAAALSWSISDGDGGLTCATDTPGQLRHSRRIVPCHGALTACLDLVAYECRPSGNANFATPPYFREHDGMFEVGQESGAT
jgi:hypothetical protein